MSQFLKKFIAVLVLDAILILFAAGLLLRHFWQYAMAIVATLFVANLFLVPMAARVKGGDRQVLDKGRSRLWFFGFALLAAALVRLILLALEGFSWPALAGVITGFLLGTLFLFIAKKSREPIP